MPTVKTTSSDERRSVPVASSRMNLGEPTVLVPVGARLELSTNLVNSAFSMTSSWDRVGLSAYRKERYAPNVLRSSWQPATRESR